MTNVASGGEPSARKRRLSPKTILLAVIVAALVWFVLVNRQHTHIKLWLVTVDSPVWLLLLCTFAAGGLVGLLLRRRRRR